MMEDSVPVPQLLISGSIFVRLTLNWFSGLINTNKQDGGKKKK